MNILLLLSQEKKVCGNWTTLSRIQTHFETAGFFCSTRNAQDVNQSFWKNCKTYSVVFAIHALHCSEMLYHCPFPIVLIFGGTDLNEYSQDASCFKIMTQVVEKVRFAITFGSSMSHKAISLWPNLPSERIKEIPQAVVVSKSSFSLKNYLKTHKGVNAKNIFLLVAGIRPVKDPLFLVESFSQWHEQNCDSFLVVIGDERHSEYYETFTTRISLLNGIILLPEMSREDVLSCMNDSFALVNSSLSEGMSAAILEAMSQNLLVMARDIPGNRDLIEHKVTGFLYLTTRDFFTQANLILNDFELRSKIVANAKNFIKEKHAIEREAKAYCDILSVL